MSLAFVGADLLAQTLTMTDAVDALERAFAATLPAAPARSHLDTGTGDLLLMPAWGEDAAGVKLVTVAPGNPARELPLIQGVYVLFEKPSLTPVALFDAAALTALRTAAVSGVATRHLSRQDALCLVIFGAGIQARSHLEAMAAVRVLEEVRVVSRSGHRAREVVDIARASGLDADIARADAVADADIVCTCTTSSNPVFDGKLLSPGVHVNAIGSYKRSARELDDFVMAQARVVVDTQTALQESGDLVAPIESGVLQRNEIDDLGSVVRGGRGRVADTEMTVFKSVGAAFEDLVVAQAAVERL